MRRVFLALLSVGSLAAAPLSPLTPIRLRSGTNVVPNIAGDGQAGSISLDWRENGNAWSYDIFTVRVAGSIATIEGADQLSDRPHTGEDMITSVRFARGFYRAKQTTFVLISDRDIVDSVPAPASTRIRVFALVKNVDGLGTPYEFAKVKEFRGSRLYCNADMALKTEIGFPLAGTYRGPRTIDGC